MFFEFENKLGELIVQIGQSAVNGSWDEFGKSSVLAFVFARFVLEHNLVFLTVRLFRIGHFVFSWSMPCLDSVGFNVVRCRVRL